MKPESNENRHMTRRARLKLFWDFYKISRKHGRGRRASYRLARNQFLSLMRIRRMSSDHQALMTPNENGWLVFLRCRTGELAAYRTAMWPPPNRILVGIDCDDIPAMEPTLYAQVKHDSRTTFSDLQPPHGIGHLIDHDPPPRVRVVPYRRFIKGRDSCGIVAWIEVRVHWVDEAIK